MVYLLNGSIHASNTGRLLHANFGWGGMKRLMEEAATRHVEAIHYSTSVGIHVGEKVAKPDTKPGFWPVVLETFFGGRLQKGEASRTEERVREVKGWSDQVEENTGFVEATCRNYEALIDERRAGKTGGAGPSGRYDTRSGPKRHNATLTGS